VDFPAGGVLIVKVEEGSPADRAGLKRYDLIVEVNGKRVKKAVEISQKIAVLSPGDKVELGLYRKVTKKTITVTVGQAPDTMKYRSSGDEGNRIVDLGMVLVNNSRALAKEYGLRTSSGILVKQVDRGGVAYRNRLRQHDVILEVNMREIDDVEEFRELVSRKKPGSTLLLYVNRDGEEGTIRFKLPE
jgi:serine protease Do